MVVQDLVRKVHLLMEVHLLGDGLDLPLMRHQVMQIVGRWINRCLVPEGKYFLKFEDAFQLDVLQGLEAVLLNAKDLLFGAFTVSSTLLRWLCCTEALFYKRAEVNTQVDPLVTFDKTVWNSHMHLVVGNLFGAIAEHYPSPRLY